LLDVGGGIYDVIFLIFFKQIISFGICLSFIVESGYGDLVCCSQYWTEASDDPKNARAQCGAVSDGTGGNRA
jgi:hypothetical protein